MPSTALVAKEIQVQSGLGEQIMANKGSKYKNTKEQKEIFFLLIKSQKETELNPSSASLFQLLMLPWKITS